MSDVRFIDMAALEEATVDIIGSRLCDHYDEHGSGTLTGFEVNTLCWNERLQRYEIFWSAEYCTPPFKQVRGEDFATFHITDKGNIEDFVVLE